MGVTEIARALGIAPGTAFRGLDALQRAHLLARHPSAPRYVLGPGRLGLATEPARAVSASAMSALPYLRQLASATRRDQLAPRPNRLVCRAHRDRAGNGRGDERRDAQRDAQPSRADCAGRAILAHLSTATRSRAICAWAAARGHRDSRRLERDLAAIRARGFAQRSGPDGGVAFPIRKLDQAFASVAIEGSGICRGASKTAACTAKRPEIAPRHRSGGARQSRRSPINHSNTLTPIEIVLPS